MKNNAKTFHSLSRRIVFQFCVFTLIVSLVFGLLSMLLMYALEDSFIEKGVMREASYLSTAYQDTGVWPASRSPNMQLHFSRETFPADFRDIAIEEPERTEFFGDQGRHYNLHHFTAYPGVYLVAEVSSELIVRQMRDGVIQLLLISAGIVTVIACLIAWFIGRKTTRPLKQLAHLVSTIAPEKLPDNFSVNFPNNEVGILARTIEHTLGRTTKAMSREKCFTRDVSHELRTPLAVMKNAVELSQSQKRLQQGEQEAAPKDEVLNRIYEAADQMEKTVHTLLMLAREEHAQAPNVSTRLMPVLEKAVLDNRFLLVDKEVDIDICGSCDISVTADSNLLKVLLDNLLSNAFKYTDAGLVKIDVTGGNTLMVSDTGPGIDAAISSAVTEPGVKGEQSTGFGFGLSIVKRLCEHQGWKMKVNSSNGTTVSVLFPL